LNELKEAKILTQNILNEHGQNASMWHLLGDIYSAENNVVDAEKTYKEALAKIDFENPDQRPMREELRKKLNKFRTAKTEEKITTTHPEDVVECSLCSKNVNSTNKVICEICKKDLCPDCRIKCDTCGKFVCKDYSINDVNHCSERCAKCGAIRCKNCILLCNGCKEYRCEVCAKDTNLGRCTRCNKSICKECSKYCKICGNAYCEECGQKDLVENPRGIPGIICYSCLKNPDNLKKLK
jgi:hypothetical protein